MTSLHIEDTQKIDVTTLGALAGILIEQAALLDAHLAVALHKSLEANFNPSADDWTLLFDITCPDERTVNDQWGRSQLTIRAEYSRGVLIMRQIIRTGAFALSPDTVKTDRLMVDDLYDAWIKAMDYFKKAVDAFSPKEPTGKES